MKLLLGLWLFAAVLLVPLAAHAQETPPPRDFSARFETGFGAWTSRTPETSVFQYRFTLAPEFAYRDIVRIAPIFRMTGTNIDLRQKDGMPFDSSLTFPWQPSLGLRLHLQMLHYHWFRMGLRGEVEFPLGENSAWISSFTPRGEIADAPIDVETLRNHVNVGHQWTTSLAAVTLAADVGVWRPFVDVGLIHISSRLSVDFDAEATTLLRDVDVSPKRFYNSGDTSFYYLLGSEFTLPHGFGLRLGATLLPGGNDRWFFAGEGSVFIPMNFGSF